MDLYDKLKKYFDETPKEQVLKDWEETKIYDNVNSPTVEQFLLHSVMCQRELFICDCGCTNHYKNETHDSIMCADCGTVYANI